MVNLLILSELIVGKETHYKTYNRLICMPSSTKTLIAYLIKRTSFRIGSKYLRKRKIFDMKWLLGTL